MAYITIEVFRRDFKESFYNHFEKGYQGLKLFHLKPEIYKLACLANKVFLQYNGSELILKEK
jgi:hypothetical protein